MSAAAFMSPAWIARAKMILAEELKKQPDPSLCTGTVIDRFTALPPDAPLPIQGQPALVVKVGRSGIEVRFGAAEDERADMEIVSAWDEARRASALPPGDALDRFNAQRSRDGTITVKGALTPPMRRLLQAVHVRISGHPPQDDV